MATRQLRRSHGRDRKGCNMDLRIVGDAYSLHTYDYGRSRRDALERWLNPVGIDSDPVGKPLCGDA